MTVSENKAVKVSITWASMFQVATVLIALGGFTYSLKGDVDRLKMSQEQIQKETRQQDTRLAEMTVQMKMLTDSNRALEEKIERMNGLLLEAARIERRNSQR